MGRGEGFEKAEKWVVLFDGYNSPTSCRPIIGYNGKMVIFEDGSQYPKRLTLECNSVLSAQETLEEMIKVEERMMCECL